MNRRTLLASAGTAVAGAALGVGAGAVLPGTAGAAVTAGRPGGSTVMEFVGGIDQSGTSFTGYGYVVAVAGLPAAALFVGGQVGDPGSARLTITADATLQRRATAGAKVTLIDAAGELRVLFQDSGGASFDDPGSFGQGQLVARFDLQLQDILTVIAPNEGIPTLSGELRLVEASPATLGASSWAPGRAGQLLRLSATGHGMRSQVDPPVAHLDIAAVVTLP